MMYRRGDTVYRYSKWLKQTTSHTVNSYLYDMGGPLGINYSSSATALIGTIEWDYIHVFERSKDYSMTHFWPRLGL